MNASQSCHCPICLMEAHSIPGTRRCSGEAFAPPRKHQPRAGRRGTWKPGGVPIANEAGQP